MIPHRFSVTIRNEQLSTSSVPPHKILLSTPKLSLANLEVLLSATLVALLSQAMPAPVLIFWNNYLVPSLAVEIELEKTLLAII
jgi:hypothetical protein